MFMDLKDIPILITGGAGFIGSRLALKLVGQGARVTVFDNFHPQAHAGNPSPRPAFSKAGVTVLEGDVRDADMLDAALQNTRPKIVFHLAAETGTGQSFDEPTRYTAVNVIGTTNLIEAIRKIDTVARVILAGSRSVYGEGACVDDSQTAATAMERSPDDLAAGDYAPKDAKGRTLTPVPTAAQTCPTAPASIYASTKLMQEFLLQQGFWGTPVQVGILRLQNVFGPGQSLNNPYTGVLSIFSRQIQEGKTLEIYEDGQITRDFVLVSDVVDAFCQMAKADEMPQEIVDIGSGQATTIVDVARHLLDLFGEDPDKLTITGAFRPGDIRYGVADISLAEQSLDWRPLHDLPKGLKALVEWSRGDAKSVLEEQ